MDYKKSGVDVEAGYKSVKLIKNLVESTFNDSVLSSIGSFGGLYALDGIKDMKEPVLVSGTDGVGTKLMLAHIADKHDSIGIDCVAMCVNDIICLGAKPLFFLDYIACGKNYPEKIKEIVKGISIACIESDCALVGGETAEMPDMYKNDEYDIAGFAVGIVDKEKIIDIKKVKEGDILLGLKSSGLHSNGFSLVRKALDISKYNINDYVEELEKTYLDELLTPTKLYVKSILELLKSISPHAISNITGGGFYENIPRALNGHGAKINLSAWDTPLIFKHIQNKASISDKNMYSTFNMGIGMVLVLDKNDLDKAIEILAENGEECVVMGEVTKNEGIVLC